MIDLNPALDERDIYPLVPIKDRWIFNKLEFSERAGYRCGVSGVPLTVPGVYCIRPIYNLAGMGDGGVMRWVFDGTNQPPQIPGWFWCEWFNGYQEWVDFTDDLPVRWSGGNRTGRRLVLEDMKTEGATNSMPNQLQGFSKHMLIEFIGGKPIEAAPRHQNWLTGMENKIDYFAREWADPYFGHETFFWKVVRKP